MQKFSNDSGSSFFKLSYRQGDEIVTIKVPSRVVKGLRNKTGGDYSDVTYSVDGEYFAVSAEESNIIETTTEEFQYLDPTARILLHHALRQAGATGDVSIIETLPPKLFYNQDGSKNQALIDRKVSNLKGAILYGDNDPTINIKEVVCLPEGIPALQHVLNENQISPAKYLVADLGGTTLDLYVISSQFVIEKFTSIDCGVLFMVQELSKFTTSSESIPHSIIIDGLITGNFKGLFTDQQISNALAKFKSKVLKEIQGFTDIRLIDGVVCTGGGFELLKGKAETLELQLAVSKPVYMSKESQHDNSLGGLAILESIG